jgi:hypothetical protein
MDIGRLTDYTVDGSDSIMDIRSELLDPIVSSSYRYQFRLDTASFLDRNTLLLFKPRATNGGDSDNLRMNCWNGGLGAIRAVEFQIGDFQVQRIEDINAWSSLNMLYNLPPDVQTKKLGHYIHNQLQYEASDTVGAGVSDLIGQIQVDNTNSGINYGQSDDATGAAINSMKLNSNASNNHKIGIPLGMLFPMINDRELPLFLFTNYKVHITIEFESDASKYANNITKTNFAGNEFLQASDGDVSYSDVQLLVDYLVLPARVQNNVLEQTTSEGGYMIDFVNPLNIAKRTNALTAQVENQDEFRINVVNQEIHYVQMLKQMDLSGNAKQFYNKVLLGQRVDGVSLEQIQYNVNGVDIYTAGFVSNPVELYNNCSYALGRDLQVVKPLYMNDPATAASLLSPPQLGLLGKYKPLMLDLRNGEPVKRGGGRFIGEYPIRVIYKRTPHAESDCQYFAANNFECAEDETRATNFTFFVGSTRVLNVKTMPNGSMNVVLSDM